MKVRSWLAPIGAFAIAACIVGCNLGLVGKGSKGSDASPRTGNNGDRNSTYYINDGKQFMPGDGNKQGYMGNPLINNTTLRNSSDPAVSVFHNQGSNRDVLVMVTSSDMDGSSRDISHYPMNTTYMYTTSTIDGKWYDHGAVLYENELAWVRPNGDGEYPYHLWAPDVQYCANENRLYLYVPGSKSLDDHTQRIGIASAQIKTGTDGSGHYELCGPFTAESGFLNIHGHDDGYAYDPGICDMPDGSYYMTYCDGEAPAGRIHIAKMRAGNMKEADEVGRFSFTNNIVIDPNVSTPVDLNDMYMEGPDLSVFSVNRSSVVYLVFAAKLENPDSTERIGYATMTWDEFSHHSNTGWNFRGWIFQQVKGQPDDNTHYTNHADLAKYNGHYYVFYHKIATDSSSSRNRQVCTEEFFLDDSGNIQFWGQNPAAKLTVASPNYHNYGVSLPGTDKGAFWNTLQCAWTGSGKPTYLTLCDTVIQPPQDFQATSVFCQYLHSPDSSTDTDWNTQEWIVENSVKSGQMQSTDHVRLRNAYKKDLYLTATSDRCEDNNNYEVQGKTLHDGWDSQIWIMENGRTDPTGVTLKRFKCAWGGAYLTLRQTTDGAIVGTQKSNTGWASQEWYIR